MTFDPVNQRSKEELEQAVSTLMAFTNQTDKWVKHSKGHGLKKRFKTFFNLIKSFLLWWRKKQDARLAHAIKVIKKHAKWLEQAQRSGSKEDKELVKVTKTAVEHFNATLEKFNRKLDRNLFFLLAKSLRSQNKSAPLKQQLLVIPGPAIMENSSSAQTLFQATFSPATELTHLEHDTFLMKAIRVIEKERLLPPGSLYEEVRQGKIDSQTEEGQKTFMLRLDNLPGEELKLVGRVGSKSEIQYQLRSEQTGFPDPLLSTGWTLSSSLLPEDSDEEDKPSPLIRDWLKEKKKLAESLLPHGSCNTKAKERIKYARILFENEKAAILSLHAKLWYKIFSFAGLENETEEQLFSEINEYFGKEPSFDQFCKLTRGLNNFFLDTLSETSHGKERPPSNHLKDAPAWSLKLGKILEKECLPIYIHLHRFDLKTNGLTDFQMSLLSLAFFEQLMFSKEMEDEKLSKESVKRYLYSILEGSLQILDGTYLGLAEHALDLAHEAESHAQVKRWQR